MRLLVVGNSSFERRRMSIGEQLKSSDSISDPPGDISSIWVTLDRPGVVITLCVGCA